MAFGKKISLVLIWVSLSVSAQAQWLGFSVKQEIPVSGRVYNFAIAHTNDDDFKDLITFVSEEFTTVSILSGDDENNFTTLSSFEKPEQYRLLNTGDIDRDGIDDLVISSYWGNGFKIYWGSANGEYTEGTHYPLTGHGKNLKVVDMNDDGALDVVALSGGSGQPITLHMFYGSNARTLTPTGIFTSLLHTDRAITIIDKNKDGLKDVMVSSSFPWFIIFYQEPNGNFRPQYWPYELMEPWANEYLLADFNNDTKEDVLAHYYDEGFRFFEGKEDTLFNETYESVPISINPSRIILTDLNHDGNTDILFTSYDENDEPTTQIHYLLGRGDFNFDPLQSTTFDASVENLMSADFNGDEFTDIIVYTSDQKIITLINDGLMTGTEEGSISMNAFPSPFQNILQLDLSTYPVDVRIFNVNGVMQSQFVATESVMITTSSWPAGLYIVSVSKGKIAHQLKVVKY